MLHAGERIRSDASGIAMITVVLGMAIAFVTGGFIILRGAGDLHRAGDDRRWEHALQAAEAGLDHALFLLNDDRTYDTGETIPGSFADEDAEFDWVEAQATDNLSGSVEQGEWVILKPENEELVYALGYVPSIGDPNATVRMIRAEYDFAPFRPEMAVLSDGDLTVSGNPAIDGLAGSVHANGDVLISGSPDLTGSATAVGTYTETGNPTVGDAANTGGGKPSQEVPTIDPRDYYTYADYDLCPDGTVHAGPAYAGPEANVTLTPCAGGLLADANAADYRGWRKTGTSASEGTKWGYSSSTSYDGVYYAYQGSITVSGSPGTPSDPWRTTLIAEASAAGGEPHCPHTGGDIDVTGNPDVATHPSVDPMLFIAGRDIDIGGTTGTSYDGVIVAHEQFRLAGTPDLSGVIIGADVCDTAGSDVSASDIVGNANVTYDGDRELPTGSVIRVTLWLEL